MGRRSHPGTEAEVGCIDRASLFGHSRLHFLKKNLSQVENTRAFERSENTWFFTFRKTKVLHYYSFGTRRNHSKLGRCMVMSFPVSMAYSGDRLLGRSLQVRRPMLFPRTYQVFCLRCRFLMSWLWGGHFIFISNVLGFANFCLASCPNKSLRASICSSEDHCGQATMWLN